MTTRVDCRVGVCGYCFRGNGGMIELMLTALLALTGATIYRARGIDSVYKYLPRPIPQLAYAVIYMAAVLMLTGNQWLALAVWAATAALVSKGHGRVMNFGPNKDSTEFEDLTFPIWWLDGRVKPVVYDFIGQCLIGLWYALPAGLAIGWHDPVTGALIWLSGASKGPAYAIGHAIGRKGTWPHYIATPTRIGEALTGAFGWGSVAAILYFIT